MRLRLIPLVLLQLAAALAFTRPAEAAYVVYCETDYVRTGGSYYESYESGYGYGACSAAVSRIDVRLSYVYCPNSDPASCNTSGSGFTGDSGFNTTYAEARGAIYNLRGWYKAIVRTSFTLTSDQVFSGSDGPYWVVRGSCGQSGTNYYSCAYETEPFYRGYIA